MRLVLLLFLVMLLNSALVIANSEFNKKDNIELHLKLTKDCASRKSDSCGKLGELEYKSGNYEKAIEAFQKHNNLRSNDSSFLKEEYFDVIKMREIIDWQKSCKKDINNKICLDFLGPDDETCRRHLKKIFTDYKSKFYSSYSGGGKKKIYYGSPDDIGEMQDNEHDYVLIKSNPVNFGSAFNGSICTFRRSLLSYDMPELSSMDNDNFNGFEFSLLFDQGGQFPLDTINGKAKKEYDEVLGIYLPKNYKIELQKNAIKVKNSRMDKSGKSYYACEGINFLIDFPCPDERLEEIVSKLDKKIKFKKLISFINYSNQFVATFKDELNLDNTLIFENSNINSKKNAKLGLGKIDINGLELFAKHSDGKYIAVYSDTQGSNGEARFYMAYSFFLINGKWVMQRIVDSDSSLEYDEKNFLLNTNRYGYEDAYGPFFDLEPLVSFSNNCPIEKFKKLDLYQGINMIIDMRDIQSPVIIKCEKNKN